MSRRATCHPDRPVYAGGLCQPCYSRAHRHPMRPKMGGVTRLGTIPPRPIGGVVQHRILIDPDQPLEGQLLPRCDKCGNPRLTLTGREFACRAGAGGCGRTWYLVAGAPLTRLEIPSERTRYRLRARAEVA